MVEMNPSGNVAQCLYASSGGYVNADYDAYGLNYTDRFGNPVPPPVGQPFGYQAQWGARTDGETGLVLMGWRYYDPAAGRFLTRDPIGYSGGLNLYGYVEGNPVNWVDPLGLAPIPPSPIGVYVDENIKHIHDHQNKHGFVDTAGYLLGHLVPSGHPWDYKQEDPIYEKFGNFNYGACAAAAGIPEQVALRGAGWAQRRDGTSSPQWGVPWGAPPYGDDPKDQEWIKIGYQYYRENYTIPVPTYSGYGSGHQWGP